MGLLNVDAMADLDRDRLRLLADRAQEENVAEVVAILKEFRNQLPASKAA